MPDAESQLRAARRKVVGSKQTTKAIARGDAKLVFIAADADARLREDITRQATEQGIPVITIESMIAIGRACAIDVGSATAAVIEE